MRAGFGRRRQVLGANNVGQLGQGHIENMGDEVAEMGQDLPYVLFPENTSATAVSAGGEHTVTW